MNLRTAAATAVLTAACSSPLIIMAPAAQAQPGGVQDRDCSDFDTQLEAQQVLEGDPLDFFRLDVDEDGIACEKLPGTPVAATAPPTGKTKSKAPSTAKPKAPSTTTPSVPTTAPTTVPPTAPPTAAPTGTAPPTAAPTETAPSLPPPTRQPSGAPPAGTGGTASGPADLALPLGLALTTLAVAGGTVLLARRRASDDPPR